MEAFEIRIGVLCYEKGMNPLTPSPEGKMTGIKGGWTEKARKLTYQIRLSLGFGSKFCNEKEGLGSKKSMAELGR